MKKSGKISRKEEVKLLRSELENNKVVFQKNIEMLQRKLELGLANENDYDYEHRKYELNKKLLLIEKGKSGVVNPIMAYHLDEDWKNFFSEMKDFEMETLDRNWQIFLKRYEGNKKSIDSINEDAVNKQNLEMEKRNGEIIEKLKSLGVDYVVEKVKEASYIG